MKLTFKLLFLVFIFSSCSSSEKEKTIRNKRVSDGNNLAYGGTLSVCEEETFSTLFPFDAVDVTSFKVISQIHDGLLEYDPKDMSLRSAVAEKWTINETSTEVVFNLRKDVKFHDDPCFKEGKGRLLTAKDVKYTFELLCTKEFEINYSALIKPYIKGAEDFFAGTSKSISGIEIIDDNTIKIILKEPSTSFLYILAMPLTSIIAQEAYEKYGKEMTVGCGPFRYTKPKDLTKDIYLVYNPDYYQTDEKGNSLPYLDSVHFSFIPSSLTQLEIFNNDEISVIEGLPSAKIAQVVSENIGNFKNTPPKTILDLQPDLSTQYYAFTCTKPPFDNVKVRQAFNYAIDRQSIVTNVLNGQGRPGMYGITPKVPVFNNYDFSRIEGYDYDPIKARKLLAEAGYPEGKGFPNVTLEVNIGGSEHKMVATEIERQINQTLGISISIDQVSFKNKIEHSKYGQSEMYRAAWVADFPSPESFLSILLGAEVPESMDQPSYPNTMRYKNATYDSLFNLGKTQVDVVKRYDYFAEAEKLMMLEAPIMVIWYTENYTMYHSKVRGFYNNGLQLADYSRVYLKEMTLQEVQEKEKSIKSKQ